MAVVETLFKRVGAVEFAPTAAASLDPGRDILLALLEAALNAELADRWVVATVGSQLAAGDPVGSTLKVGPERQRLRLNPSAWPLLAVYRDAAPARWEQASLQKWRAIWTWGVDYVLGPYQDDQDENRTDVLVAALSVMALAIGAGRHPAYAAGAPCLGPWLDTAGASTCAGFSSARIVSTAIGQARLSAGSESDIRYHAASLTLETVERDYHRADAAPALGSPVFSFAVGDAVQLWPDAIVADAAVPYQAP